MQAVNQDEQKVQAWYQGGAETMALLVAKEGDKGH